MPDTSHYTQAQGLLFLFRSVLWVHIEIASSACFLASLHKCWICQFRRQDRKETCNTFMAQRHYSRYAGNQFSIPIDKRPLFFV